MLSAIAAIESVDWGSQDLLGKATVNVGVVRGGEKPNIIPASAECELMFRTAGDHEEVRAKFLEMAGAKADEPEAKFFVTFEAYAKERNWDEDASKANDVLAEVTRHLGILMQPFVPTAAAKLLDQLAVPADARDFAHIGTTLKGGTQLPAPAGVFPRYGDPKVLYTRPSCGR